MHGLKTVVQSNNGCFTLRFAAHTVKLTRMRACTNLLHHTQVAILSFLAVISIVSAQPFLPGQGVGPLGV